MSAGDVKGLESLLRKFSKLDGNIQKETINLAIRRAGAVVQAQAKRKAPANDGELRQKIHVRVKTNRKGARAEVYSSVNHAIFVELGTGPKGRSNHAGISPNVHPSYRTEAWWIKGDDISEQVARKYKFVKSISKDGQVFYRTSGQKAQPYLYPALIKSENKVKQVFMNTLRGAVRGVSK